MKPACSTRSLYARAVAAALFALGLGALTPVCHAQEKDNKTPAAIVEVEIGRAHV